LYIIKKNEIKKFLGWGFLSTAAGFATFGVLHYFFAVWYVWAIAGNQLVNISMSFYLHRVRTFEDKKDRVISEALTYSLFMLGLFAANLGLASIVIEYLNLQHKTLGATCAQLGVGALLVPLRYLASKFVFSDPKAT
jgi:putative flippase GtrA